MRAYHHFFKIANYIQIKYASRIELLNLAARWQRKINLIKLSYKADIERKISQEFGLLNLDIPHILQGQYTKEGYYTYNIELQNGFSMKVVESHPINNEPEKYFLIFPNGSHEQMSLEDCVKVYVSELSGPDIKQVPTKENIIKEKKYDDDEGNETILYNSPDMWDLAEYISDFMANNDGISHVRKILKIPNQSTAFIINITPSSTTITSYLDVAYDKYLNIKGQLIRHYNIDLDIDEEWNDVYGLRFEDITLDKDLNIYAVKGALEDMYTIKAWNFLE